MDHETRTEGEIVIVVLRGDVDLEQSPRARQVLLEAVGRARAVITDLSGVGYMDSSGVASLVEAFQAARSRGGRFALAAVSANVLRVLELARLDRVFTIHATVEEARRGS
jgi:anti-sigma B factor antagonist